MMPTYLLTIALALLAAAPAHAQDTTLDDARWVPWLGCWRLVQDDGETRARAVTNPEDVLVCVRPASGNRGVGMTTYVGGQSVLQQTIVADGATHPVSEPECNGIQRSEWSLTGQRLLTRANIACSDQPARSVSAITLMTAGPTWVDIQAVGVDQDAKVRIRRYERSDTVPDGVISPTDLHKRAVAAARLAGSRSTAMTLEEVVDASAKVVAPTVQAALYETASRFDLNSRTLRELDAAGVPDGVVDVMVAMSFPDHVGIDRSYRGPAQTRGTTVASVRRSTRRPLYAYSPYYPPSMPYYPPSMYYPYYAYDPYYAYRPYSPYYFHYSPFGYSNWWSDPYRPYYSPGRRPVVIRPGRSARPDGDNRDRGQVVQGRGYTRGGSASVADDPPSRRERAADEKTSANSGATSSTSSRRAVSRGGYTSGRTSAGAGSVSRESRGSGANSGGSRSGRTAQPR